MRAIAAVPALLLLAAPARAVDLGLVRVLDGTVQNGQFGISCVVVGDMDGDGFAEYAIGASADSTGGAGAGRVFIYRGGSQHMGEPPGWSLTGLPGDLLGASLAAGDVDGDGLADLIVGAPAGTTVDPSLPGRILVAYGSPILGARAPVAVSGPAPGGRFGAAVAGLSGFRGAGLTDIAVGAPDAANGAGVVQVFPGGLYPSTPAFTLHGRSAGDNFGAAVAAAGRTRGGAYADLLVGAPYNSDARVWAGKAYLYFGGASPDTVPDASWFGAAAGDFLGTSLAGAGDVNGDGRDDVLIGAPGANVGSLVDAGRAYLYLGAPTPPELPAMTVSGATPYAELGLAVAGIGDVNADGVSDWAVGAPSAPDTNTAGAVEVFLGRGTPIANPDTTLAGEASEDMFGHAISNGGLIDAGHLALFIVGSYVHGGSGRGYLYGSVNATAGVATGAGQRLRFEALWPNPTRGSVRVSWAGHQGGPVTLELLDLGGRRVRPAWKGDLGPGMHEHSLDASGLPAGLYFVRLTTAGVAVTRRLVVTR